MTDDRINFAKGRDSFIQELGLRAHNFGTFEAATIRRFEWPAKANGTRYDRTVLLAVYPDGSWQAFLDDPHLKIEDSLATFRRMVLADELVTHVAALSAGIGQMDGHTKPPVTVPHDEIIALREVLQRMQG